MEVLHEDSEDLLYTRTAINMDAERDSFVLLEEQMGENRRREISVLLVDPFHVETLGGCLTVNTPEELL